MNRKKIINGRNYGSIPHLLDSSLGKHDKFLHSGQDAIVRKGGRDRHDKLIVSVKLDGTNVGVIKQNGQLISLQRKGYGCAASPYRQHHEFDAWMHDNHKRFDDLLAEGERVAGEWLWQASGIRYEITGDPFLAFDIFTDENMRLPWAETIKRLQSAGFNHPAYVEVQKLNAEIITQLMSDFDKWIPAKPIGEAHEGFITRIERRGQFDFMAKWVRPDFEAGKFLPGLNENSPADITINQFL